MNAKFEKWADENGYMLDKANGMSGDSFISADTLNAWNGYKAALQSLEVTPELVGVYCAAVNEHLGNLTKKQWVLEQADPIGSIERAANIGLTAVFNAIKEQAK